MTIILTSINLVAPLMLLIAIGYLLKDQISEKTISDVSRLTLYYLLPANIFINLYNSNLSDISLGYLAYCIAAFLVVAIVSALMVLRLKLDNKQTGAILQASMRGNQIIFSLALILDFLGGAASALAAVTASIISSVNNAHAIYVFEKFSDVKKKKNIFLSVVKSPMVFASIVGLVVNLIHLPLPSFAITTLQYMSKAVTPMSLLCLGASFSFAYSKSQVKYIIIGVLIKCVLNPLIAITGALLLGFNGIQLCTIAILFSAPTAVSAFSTAKVYQSDMDLTNGIVVYSYICAIITLPIIISLLQVMNIV